MPAQHRTPSSAPALLPFHRRVLVAGVAFCIVMGLPWAGSARAEDDAAALARLRREVAQTVGDAVCGNVSFCRMLPVGHDACGNPSGWVAFNNAPGLREILETKVSEITFLEEDMHRGKPRPAACKPAPKPRLACVNGRCVIGDTSY